MESVRQALRNVRIGDAVVHENLAVFPLIVETTIGRGYLILDEGMSRGTAKVREVSESGHVPELMFVNEGDLAVLLLDGEELRGAKQNRVLNLSILAPSGKTIVIPVSCVEAGRWARSSPEFARSENVLFSKARAKKVHRVSSSMARAAGRISDQGEIWDDIALKDRAFCSSSPTAAMADIYDQLSANVGGYVEAFGSVPGQTGAVFALDGRIAGCELFDHPETLSSLLPKIVRSYALDAMENRGAKGVLPPPVEAVRDFLDEIAGSGMESFPSLGLGEDVRISGNRLAAGALVVDNRVVHLSAFRLIDDPRGAREPVAPRAAPWSLRSLWRSKVR